jgi:hypothetical protein
MGKLGPVEAQQRALREARFEERQRERQVPKTVGLPLPAPIAPAASPNALRASPNRTAAPSPNTAYARNLRWRIKNRDRYNATMRDLMRKIRAERKAAA